MAMPRPKRRNVSPQFPEKWWDWYESLPAYHADMEVRCPTKNSDGTPIAADDNPGCGSEDVPWDGDVYDCCNCGIFLCDYTAQPPHRRERGDETCG
jgi:hypothetical protein